MKAVRAPTNAIHRRTASATNSGPLSERIQVGTPRKINRSVSVSITSLEESLRRTRRKAGVVGAPEGIRTPDLRFRRPTLYPAELRARCRDRLPLRIMPEAWRAVAHAPSRWAVYRRRPGRSLATSLPNLVFFPIPATTARVGLAPLRFAGDFATLMHAQDRFATGPVMFILPSERRWLPLGGALKAPAAHPGKRAAVRDAIDRQPGCDCSSSQARAGVSRHLLARNFAIWRALRAKACSVWISALGQGLSGPDERPRPGPVRPG